jgi:hypothetical protein
MLTLAAAEGALPDISSFSQWGPLGGVLGLFVWISWYLLKALTKTLDLERAENLELRNENRALNKAIHEQYVPVLTTAMAEAAKLTQVTAETARVLQEQSTRGGRDR